ncbi:MAG: hypothetical protein ACP5HQ_06875 [Thermoprotei archaeon]
MLVLAELHPRAKREKALKLVSELGSFDGYDIPHSALGYPAVLPVAVAETVRHVQPDKTIVVNQRLYDVNELYVASLALTAKYVGFWIAFTKGDLPKFGRPVDHLTSEDAVKITKAYAGNVKAGLMVSMRKGLDKVKERLSFPADFFLVLNFVNDGSLKEFSSKLIPYLLVETEVNKETLRTLNQPAVKEAEAVDALSDLESQGFMGVIVSTLGDEEALKRIAKRI